MRRTAEIARTLVLACVVAASASCTPLGDPSISGAPFVDDFARADLGPLWSNTGGNWRIVDGKLRIQGARNHPLWLRRRLPRDVRIEFTVRSDSPAGDIKVEVFGDGVSSAQSDSYTATSYVVIFGGWNNTLDVLARLDEHGRDRVERRSRRVEMGRTYRVLIERRGGHIVAKVDGTVLVEMNDPNPLGGRGHDHFGFNDWEAALTFDDLRITPLSAM